MTMTLAAAARKGKASCRMTSMGQPGRYFLDYGPDGPTPLEGGYRFIQGLCVRRRVRETLKLWRPQLTDNQISHAVGRAYYDNNARAFDKVLGHACASLYAIGALKIDDYHEAS